RFRDLAGGGHRGGAGEAVGGAARLRPAESADLHRPARQAAGGAAAGLAGGGRPVRGGRGPPVGGGYHRRRESGQGPRVQAAVEGEVASPEPSPGSGTGGRTRW